MFTPRFDHLGSCLSIQTTEAVWSQYDRKGNKTSDMLVPETVDAKQEYLNGILSIKDSGKYHTLFLVRTCYRGIYGPDALVRVLFFDMLKERYSALNRSAAIHGISGCRHNSTARKQIQDDGDNRDGAVGIALKYKFQIAFENSRTKGYMTEKLMNAYYGHTIPIYFGDDMAASYLNEKRFINCNISDDDAENIKKVPGKTETHILDQIRPIIAERLDECIDRVIEVDDDDALYEAMLMEPILPNNQFDGSMFDPSRLGGQLKRALGFLNSYLIESQDDEAMF